MAFLQKLRERLFKSSDKIGAGLDDLVAETPVAAPVSALAPEPASASPGLIGRLFARSDAPRRVLDDAMLESLEDLLIQADLGVETAMRITAALSKGRYNKEIEPAEVRAVLAAEVERVLAPVAQPLQIRGSAHTDHANFCGLLALFEQVFQVAQIRCE